MPNSTVTAYNKAVVRTIAAADLMKVDDPEGSNKEPLTPEQAKARLVLQEGLKKLGGKLLEDTCPNCGTSLALLPKDGKRYRVCTEQFRDDPACYWVKEYIQPKPEPKADPEPENVAETATEEKRASNIQDKKSKKQEGDAPKLTYHATYFDD